VLQVSGGGFCTYTDSARFFSYRRMRDSGRMAAAVWLAPG
jgi:copper oxidase (laccase) domain-containing protein